ncbi:MAG: hypothetical protein HOY78_40875 [Saccharothrix sp.]|nr:hypothetical protein [Saccharothrix sp.]
MATATRTTAGRASGYAPDREHPHRVGRRHPRRGRRLHPHQGGALARYSPVATARLDLDGPRRVTAHGRLDVDGVPVNAKATGDTYTEAVDLLQDKLKHQLLAMRD